MFGHTRGIVLPSGERFFGFRKDHPKFALLRPKKNIAELLAHFGAATPAPSSSKLAAFRCPIFDQGPFGSCIGHGSAQLDATAFGAAGDPLGFTPSPLHGYDGARIEALGPTDAMSDSGAMPADLVTAKERYGTRDMLLTPGLVNGLTPDGRFSDCWDANVNVRPDFEDEEQGAEHLVTGEYEVTQSDTATMVAQMQAVIDVISRPIGLPWFVDTAVMGYKQGDPPIDAINLSDPNGGGHWTSCDVYETMSIGGANVVVFGVPNSWSAEYGDNGVIWVTGRALVSALLQPPFPWTVRMP